MADPTPPDPQRVPPGAPADGPDPAKTGADPDAPDYAEALRKLGREGPPPARTPAAD